MRNDLSFDKNGRHDEHAEARNQPEVRQLTRDAFALVLAGGRGTRLYELTN